MEKNHDHLFGLFAPSIHEYPYLLGLISFPLFKSGVIEISIKMKWSFAFYFTPFPFLHNYL
jgi:hypothetical protein